MAEGCYGILDLFCLFPTSRNIIPITSFSHTYSGRILKVKQMWGWSTGIFFESTPKRMFIYHSLLPTEIHHGSDVFICYREIIIFPSTRFWIDEITLTPDTNDLLKIPSLVNRHKLSVKHNESYDVLSVYCLNCEENLFLSYFVRCDGQLLFNSDDQLECEKCKNIDDDETSSCCRREFYRCNNCGTTRMI